MQIDWSKAPEWARYCAMDEDGEWYWYEDKPEAREGNWYSKGKMQSVALWSISLQERPQ